MSYSKNRTSRIILGTFSIFSLVVDVYDESLTSVAIANNGKWKNGHILYNNYYCDWIYVSHKSSKTNKLLLRTDI